MELGIAVSEAHSVSVPSEPHVTTSSHITESESSHSVSSTSHIISTHSLISALHVPGSSHDHNSHNADDQALGVACFVIFLSILAIVLFKVFKSL